MVHSVDFSVLQCSIAIYYRVNNRRVHCLSNSLCFNIKNFCFSDSCTAKSHAVISKHCILKCVELLYDNKFCTICVNGAVDMSTNIAEEEETLVDKRKLEWCTGEWKNLSERLNENVPLCITCIRGEDFGGTTKPKMIFFSHLHYSLCE